jgi:Ca-activated chloride channel family protein
MNWLSEISQTEYIYLAVFLTLYLAYFVRMYFIAKKLKINLRRILAKFLLRSSYFSLFIIALLGPSFGDIKKEIKAIGKDIYIAIDLSNSMDATDINPSRLEKIKFELSNALKNFHSDRVGIIIFTQEAFVQCPLTYDHNAVKTFLETLSTKIISAGGTDLSAPLQLAYQKLTNSNAAKEKDSQAKVLLLVTDGENFGSTEAYNWLKKIKKDNIHFFVLGVGSEQGSTIPSGNGFRTDQEGNVVQTMLHAKELRQMSQAAGGKYYEITPGSNEVKTMVGKIQKVEGALKDSKKVDSAANKYFYFLFVALGLVLIDVLVSFKTIKI